jgi:hypothetical protein
MCAHTCAHEKASASLKEARLFFPCVEEMNACIWSKRVRTFECRYQKPMPFHLAILHCTSCTLWFFMCVTKMHAALFVCNHVQHGSAKMHALVTRAVGDCKGLKILVLTLHSDTLFVCAVVSVAQLVRAKD